MRDDGSAISRALDMFQTMVRTQPTVNPTAARELIAAARAELAQMRTLPAARHDHAGDGRSGPVKSN